MGEFPKTLAWVELVFKQVKFADKNSEMCTNKTKVEKRMTHFKKYLYHRFIIKQFSEKEYSSQLRMPFSSTILAYPSLIIVLMYVLWSFASCLMFDWVPYFLWTPCASLSWFSVQLDFYAKFTQKPVLAKKYCWIHTVAIGCYGIRSTLNLTNNIPIFHNEKPAGPFDSIYAAAFMRMFDRSLGL